MEKVASNLFEESSSAYQDKFVCKILKNKQNGTFLEIGSAWPKKYSNTYILEKKLNWRGVGIEYNPKWRNEWEIVRPNTKLYINDARRVDYGKLLNDNNMPEKIDYLSFDIEAENGSTIDALDQLDKTALNKYKFGIVTFEHDIYRGDFFDTRNRSRKIFKKHGYILTYPDVTNLGLEKRIFHGFEGNDPYEDWYFHPDIIDINFINKLIQPINNNVVPFGNLGGMNSREIINML